MRHPQLSSLVFCLSSFPLLLAAAPPTPAPFQLTIDKPTTWITAPLLPDGTPDYPAALRALTAPPTPDSQNAAPLLEKALAAFHDFAETATDRPEKIRLTNYADTITNTLWSADQNPDIAAWIDRNHDALELLDQASRRPALSSPAAIDEDWLTRVGTLARCLDARAKMHAAAGDHPAARADVATLFRLAPLLQPLPDLEATATGDMFQQFALRTALLAAQAAPPSQRSQWLALALTIPDLHPSPLATASTRCNALNQVMIAVRGNPIAALTPLLSIPIPPEKLAPALQQTDLAAVDWNIVCRTLNTYFDRADKIRAEPLLQSLTDGKNLYDEVNALPAPSGMSQLFSSITVISDGPINLDNFKKISPEARLAELQSFLLRRPRESTANFSTRIAPYFLQSVFFRLKWSLSNDTPSAWRRLHITALAALDFRSRTGHFPNLIEDLHLPPDITTDPFSNEPLFCSPWKDTLTLYSVGPNRINDLGTPQTTSADTTDDIPLHLTP